MEKMNVNNTNNYQPKNYKSELKTWMNILFNAFIIGALYLVSFVDLDTNITVDWKSKAFQLILFYFASYTIFSNSYTIGKLNGAKKKIYVDAENGCKIALNTLHNNANFERLIDFCEYIKYQDLNSRRRTLLTAVCIKFDTWEKEYKDLSLSELIDKKRTISVDGTQVQVPFFDKNQIKVLRQCKRMRCHKFEPSMLTNPVTARSDEFINDPLKAERIKKIKRLVSSAMCVVITVNFGVELVKDFSFQTIVVAVVRSIPMYWAWLSGQYGGYTNSVIDKVDYFNNRAKWCERADKWLNKIDKNEVYDISHTSNDIIQNL